MGWLVGGLFGALINLLTSAICDGLSFVMEVTTELFANALGANSTLFSLVFPITADLQRAFMAIGIGLSIGMVIFGCFRNMFSGLGWAGEKPLQMVARFLIAVSMVVLLPSIMSYFYYQTGGGGSGLFATIYNGIADVEQTETGNNFGGGFFSLLANGTLSILTGGYSSIVNNIIMLILIIVIAINFLKLLLEMFERYLMVNLLIFMSPLAASTATLESTMKIFSSYIKMFIGQMLMLLMNLVSLKIISSGMASAADAISLTAGGEINLSLGISPDFMPFVVLVLIIAMLKVLQRVDMYARDIGLTVGITGGNLIDDIVSTGAIFKPVMSAMFGGGGSHKSGSAGGGSGSSASGGGIYGSPAFKGSPLGRAVNYATSVVKGANKAARDSTGLSHPTMIDTFKAMGAGGFFKTTLDNAKDFRTATVGANDSAEKAFSSVSGMMNSSVPVTNQASTARNTQMAFKSFVQELCPVAEGHTPPVDISGLSEVSVGNGGAIGTDANGDTIALTTYKPSDSTSIYTTEYTKTYQDSNGQEHKETYWAQNLSEANRMSNKYEGKEYAVYNKAQKALSNGSTNFDFESKARFKNSVPNIKNAPKSTSSKSPNKSSHFN